LRRTSPRAAALHQSCRRSDPALQALARSTTAQRDPAAFDALEVAPLGWLAAHRAAWNSQPTSFTVNLSIATLEDERFAQKIAAALNTHGIAAEAWLRDRRGPARSGAPGRALHHQCGKVGLGRDR
jgi:hypothetical protein